MQELRDIVESYNRNFISHQKLQAMHCHKQAQMIAGYVSLMFNSEGKPPEIWEFYPDLFEEERKEIEQDRIERELALHKERMRAFAQRMHGRFNTKE